MKQQKNGQPVLSIDIGGSRIKAIVISTSGELLQPYESIDTPSDASPENVIGAIGKLVANFPAYDYVSVGFPGYVKNGVIGTAPNLGTKKWAGFDLQKKLSKQMGKPIQVVNDADFQGVGLVSGKGLEMVITLGTGFGTALLLDGVLLPHMELAHHPVAKGKTYDEYVGEKEMDEIGLERWNKRVQKILPILKTVFNYDRLYISGGNAKKINFELDANMKIVSNKDGIKGGAFLWKHKV